MFFVLLFILIILYMRFLRKYNVCIIIFLSFIFILLIATNPKLSYTGAKLGVHTWFNIVIPSLLPFFIGTDILIQLGVVHLLGAFLEPLMRPIFKSPGQGSFVFLMSIASGYPIGVKLVCDLRKNDEITKIEGQRLLALCSTSGPLFILGAVGIGMFNNEHLGLIILLSHYIGAILTGFLFRYYKTDPSFKKNHSYTYNLKKSFNKIKNNNKSFGLILYSSIQKGMELMLLIGGYIILFSVIITIIKNSQIIELTYFQFNNLTSYFHIDKNIFISAICSFIEITVGCKELSNISNLNFHYQASLCAFFISLGGLSIYAQTTSFIQKTDLSSFIYAFSKIIHGFLAAILAFIIARMNFFTNDISTFNSIYNHTLYISFKNKFQYSTHLFIVVNLIFIFLRILIGKKNKA